MKIEVLDHGYVELVEAWGTGHGGRDQPDSLLYVHDYEVGLVEAARQSTQGAFRGWDVDAKLLKTLWRGKPGADEPLPPTPKHATPFEFAGLVLEVQAPIFVFREWHRHRTQSYNEMSARYAPLPELYFTPDRADLLARANAKVGNKQAQGLRSGLTEENANVWYEWHARLVDELERFYQFGLEVGVPKELARIDMPVGHYSRMRAAANLRCWLQFLTLRLDVAAQREIRLYAEAVATIVREAFPQTARLFEAARPT